MTEDQSLSLYESSKIVGVSKQALYIAIKKNKLKAHKDEMWKVKLSDLKYYVDHLYDRNQSVYNGELVFDHSKGEYSIPDAAKLLGINRERIYHLVKSGKIPYMRKGKKGWMIVIKIEDLIDYKKNFNGKCKWTINEKDVHKKAG